MTPTSLQAIVLLAPTQSRRLPRWFCCLVSYKMQKCQAISPSTSGPTDPVSWKETRDRSHRQMLVGRCAGFHRDDLAGSAEPLLRLPHGIFSGPLSEVFTTIPVLVGGSALAAAGMIASAFVPDITWLTVTLGVIHGIGLGIVTTMLQVLISMYFERFRGAANGSMFAGYTASAFIFPKLLLYFSDAYGFRGSLLLFGGILLNMAAVSLAFREPPWICCERAKRRKDAKDPQRPSLTIAKSNIGTRTFLSKDAVRKLQGVLKCGMMYILVVTWIVFSYIGDVFLNTIVDFAMDKGLSVDDAVSIETYTAVTDIVGRTFLPCLVDWRILPQSTLMSLDYFLLGLSAVSLSFCQSYWTLLTACLGMALFIGCAMTMQSVLMAHYLGLDKLSVGYTVLGAMSAPAFLAKATFVGFFRDDLGSYNEMFWVLGSSSMFVSVLWVFVSLDDRKSTRRWEPNDVHASRKPNT
ncbi:hypothetical protein HPB50_013734 [Hyalomma asiaticum]|uniref:Uncharacterized protein n=1 Tax=Hyalomma asiaticum TaxID=266040 RepID=A0ACB7SF36_HYAAI|nr:hypothetical protein HPB50_013734 [Hyalomma asiaticum]